MTWPILACAVLLVLAWPILAGLYIAGSRRVRPIADDLREAGLAAGRPPGGDPAAALPAPDSSSTTEAPLPSLSIVISARDEAPSIEATVRHALAQDYPGLEIIAVDDRSGDGTGGILDRLAAGPGAARLRVVHVRDLPAGWIGKCHACREGARRATGAFLLFMDGDVTLAAPGLLAALVRWMEIRRIDHLALFPDLRPYGAAQAGLMHVFEQAMLLMTRAWEMERDRPRGGAGVGAFNLVRRTSYERAGGHEPLRMEVGDDYKLGMLLKETGARQRIRSGLDLVRCPWHRGTLAVLRGLEKNMFAGPHYSLGLLAGQTVAMGALNLGPIAIGLVAGTPAGWVPLAVQAVCVLAAAASAAHRMATNPLVLAALHPLSVTLLTVAVWNSALRTIGQGGVRWRGTFYPLAELRRGLVRPGDGRRRLAGGSPPGA